MGYSVQRQTGLPNGFRVFSKSLLQDADAHQKRAEAPLTPRDGLAQRLPEEGDY